MKVNIKKKTHEPNIQENASQNEMKNTLKSHHYFFTSTNNPFKGPRRTHVVSQRVIDFGLDIQSIMPNKYRLYAFN